ncbi:protein Wnt-7b-like, partial [Manduca sexta]|uniref:protein Wnt-7b-like n=1 Tax=Manduca sexta TaxID=7130 RepID=UPI00188F88A3
GGACGGVSLGAHLVCAKAPGLTDKQRAMCRASPAAIAAIGDGLRMAYEECRVQLSGRRWNCSGVGDGNHFGHVMPMATREAAFTYAITSAGVTHALSMACARGELPACGCTANRRRVVNAVEQFQWGGCGSGAFGARVARRFLDARELERDARALMNLHNNRVGRKVSEVLRTAPALNEFFKLFTAKDCSSALAAEDRAAFLSSDSLKVQGRVPTIS